jgi:serine/threonine protein kinase
MNPVKDELSAYKLKETISTSSSWHVVRAIHRETLEEVVIKSISKDKL